MPLAISVCTAMGALHASDKRKAAEFITDAGYEVGRLERLLAESQENELRALRSLERALLGKSISEQPPEPET